MATEHKISRLHDSYYQTREPDWEDLYIKGFRYNTSGWLHSSHKDFVDLLNKSFIYSYNEYNSLIQRYKMIFEMLANMTIRKCDYHYNGNYFSFTFGEKFSGGTGRYEEKFVDTATLDYSYRKTPSGDWVKDSYVINLNYRNNQGSSNVKLSVPDGNMLIDIIAIGTLIQLDNDPNCIAYYIYSKINILDQAFQYGWIRK